MLLKIKKHNLKKHYLINSFHKENPQDDKLSVRWYFKNQDENNNKKKQVTKYYAYALHNDQDVWSISEI